MRIWHNLSPEEKERAITIGVGYELQYISESIPDYLPEEIRENVQKAWAEMECNRTPWFITERLMEDEDIAAYVRKEAEDVAVRSYYLEDDEIAVRLSMGERIA